MGVSHVLVIGISGRSAFGGPLRAFGPFRVEVLACLMSGTADRSEALRKARR